MYPKVSVQFVAGLLGTNDPCQFIKNRQLVLPNTIDLQLASVLLSSGK
jgi:hypothetical protein